MWKALLIGGGLVAFTFGVSWAFYRASDRSAVWNMVIGALVVVIAAVVLTLLAIYLANMAFGRL